MCSIPSAVFGPLLSPSAMPVSNGGALATNTAPGLGMAPQRLREVSRWVAEQSKRLCCKNARGNTMGVTPRFLLSLGGQSKQAGDERDLPQDVPFFHATYLPFPDHVHELISL